MAKMLLNELRAALEAAGDDKLAIAKIAVDYISGEPEAPKHVSRRMRKKLMRAAAVWKPPIICTNCGGPGAHFVPPSFGEAGFYACPAFAALIGDNGHG